MSFRRAPTRASDPATPGVAPLVASPEPAVSPPPCPPEAPHIAVLVGEVAARLAAAVLEVGEAAAVEQGGPLAAPRALEGLHEAVVEAVVARAHPSRLAHRRRLRTGAGEPRDLPSDCTRPAPPALAHPCEPSRGRSDSLGFQPSRASSALSPPPVHTGSALLALLPLLTEWPFSCRSSTLYLFFPSLRGLSSRSLDSPPPPLTSSAAWGAQLVPLHARKRFHPKEE